MITFKYFIILLLGFERVRGQLTCTINNLRHNYLLIEHPVFDDDLETKIPHNYNLTTQNVKDASIDTTKTDKVTLEWSSATETVTLTVKQLDEKNIMSQSCDYFYNFIIKLTCEDGSTVDMRTSFQIIDSNNHQPAFEKPKYTFDLVSKNMRDFYRLQELNPIAAYDYDLTNGEVIFSISTNNYFDIKYDGIVPGTKNKKHYAKLVPKVPGTELGTVIATITVTDVGYPPQKSTSILTVNPPMPPRPIFIHPSYIGHLYYNTTFRMEENPKLEAVTGDSVLFKVETIEGYVSPFQAKVQGDEIIIEYVYKVTDLEFFKYNYGVYVLTAIYSVNSIYSSEPRGSTTLIVQFHHDF